MAAGGVVGTAPAGAVARTAGATGGPPAALPLPARTFLGALVGAAGVVLGAALFALAGAPATAGAAGAARGVTLATVVALVVVAVLAQLFPVKVAPGHAVTLAAAVFYAAVLLSPPAAAVLVAGLGQLLGQAALAGQHPPGGRRRRGPTAVAFNTAQAVLAAGAGAMVYAALRPAPDALAAVSAPAVPGGAAGMTAAAAAAAVMLAVNTGAVATMVALQRGGSPWTTWRGALGAALPEATGDYVLGYLVAWAIARDPWLLLPVAGGAVVVRQAVWGRAALARREVELAQREAETTALRRADRLKDEFLGTISHELRTPLTVVCGFTELLLRRRPGFDPATHNQISYISDSGKHLARLVDDLLDFARLQRGALPVEPRPVDLTPLLARSVDELRARPGAERLTTELPPALPAVADPERVTQIATNLLTNALKYAPEGPITLRAGVAPGADALVRVEVEDAGPGIALEEQGRIWEKFYRCASSSPGGAGIGLSVVRALAEAQGGAAGVWSAPGRGSRFWFDLPAAGDAAD